MSSLQRIMILEGSGDRTFFILAKERHKPEPPALLENSGYDNKSKRYEQSGCAFFPLLSTPTNTLNIKQKFLFVRYVI